MTRICIYGAGLIGCYLGGRLLAAGGDVRFVGRPAIGEVLTREGLTVSHYDGRSWHVPPEAIVFGPDATMASDADLVLVTVKSGGTAVAARDLAGALPPAAAIVSFQNGLGNGALLREALGDRTVLDGMVPFNVVSKEPGRFHQASEGHLYVQAGGDADQRLAIFGRAGLTLTRPVDMRSVQWAKLLLNLNNAINALAGQPLKQELSQRGFRRCLAAAQREALSLLDKAGIEPARLTPLPARDPRPARMARPRLPRAGAAHACHRPERALLDGRRPRGRPPHRNRLDQWRGGQAGGRARTNRPRQCPALRTRP